MVRRGVLQVVRAKPSSRCRANRPSWRSLCFIVATLANPQQIKLLNMCVQANSLLWKHLSAAQIRTLGDETSPLKTKQLIRDFLLSDEEDLTGAAAEVQVDFHFYNLAFARDCSFSPDKISTFMSIALEVLNADRADGLRTMEASFEEFKQHLLSHSVDRSPYSVAIFTVDDVRGIVDYFTNAYYRHFRLYKYTLAAKPGLALEQVDPCGVEAPTAWRPLADALVQDIEIVGPESGEDEGDGEGEQETEES